MTGRAATLRAREAEAHTFRQLFATHPLEERYDIRTPRELLGQRAAMFPTHVLNRAPAGVQAAGAARRLKAG